MYVDDSNDVRVKPCFQMMSQHQTFYFLKNPDIFLFNPFDTLSKLLLQIYPHKLKYGLGRQLLKQNICRWHRYQT